MGPVSNARRRALVPLSRAFDPDVVQIRPAPPVSARIPARNGQKDPYEFLMFFRGFRERSQSAEKLPICGDSRTKHEAVATQPPRRIGAFASCRFSRKLGQRARTRLRARSAGASLDVVGTLLWQDLAKKRFPPGAHGLVEKALLRSERCSRARVNSV